MVGIFAPSEIAELRDEMTAALTERATIRRSVRSDDGAGGYTTTTQIVASGVPCFRAPEVSGIGEALVGGQDVQGLRWKIFLRHGTPVQDNDQVDIGVDSYDVLAAASPATAQAATVVYALRR